MSQYALKPTGRTNRASYYGFSKPNMSYYKTNSVWHKIYTVENAILVYIEYSIGVL